MATTAPLNTHTPDLHPGVSADQAFSSYLEHFEYSAGYFADRCALSMEGQFLSYAELHKRARAWEERFRRQGCQQETVVAICIDRSMELVPLLLGVLMSGAAFLPLDPQVAPERTRNLVQRSGVAVVVTQHRYSHIFTECNANVWHVESAVEFHADRGQCAPSTVSDPASMAYLIYTSGSTGTPKGVAITHKSFYHYIRWATNYYAFSETGVSVLHTSIAFDLTLTSIFCPLLLGMRILLVPESHGIEGIARLLNDRNESISLLKMTPSHLQLLFAPDGAVTHSWDCGVLIVGGEQLSATLVRAWEHSCRAGKVFNEYGPTEATVGCCATRVRSDDAIPNGAIPIGHAIDQVDLRLYDKPYQSCETAQEGELFIGGVCLARGYFGLPAATAEKFVPDPAGNSDRLYRTGDWVRKLDRTDCLVFAGRKDRQVKIAGVRVELEEIECILREFPGVQDAVAALTSESDGKQVLVAFLSVSDPYSDHLELSALNRHLQARLHSSIVPNSFYLLKRFPLAASGKVHLEKLIRERSSYLRLSGPYLPPRTPTEELLASLWRPILGREEISIDDSFFALDGNSMKSIQFVYEARKHGLPLSTRDVFERQSIRALGELVDAPKIVDSELTRIRSARFALVDQSDRESMPQNVIDAYPLAMLQAGTVFESNAHFDSGTYHNVNSYHIACELNVSVLEKSLSLIASRHPILRTSYDYVNFREPLQLVHRDAKVRLQVVDISHLDAKEQERYVSDFVDQEAKNHFDWTKPPLFRIFIHIRGQGRFQFTLSKHHSILDGWSAATLIAETMQNYFALLKGQPPPFEMPIERTYREYVALEREALHSPEHQDFWRQTLQDAPEHTFRPWGNQKARTNGAHSFAASRTVPIDHELSNLLKECAKRAQAPLKSVLLAVHLRVLAEMTGNARLVTGVVSHGRPDLPDADRALGLFINTVPFHILVEEQFTWFDLIRRVFSEERRVFPYQRYPMARMKKDAGGRNVFESIFYYTDFHVFRDFRDSSDVRCIDSIGFEQTEIPFTAAFSRHPLTSEISLVLHFHASHFSEPQTTAIVGYFKQALMSLAHTPKASVLGAQLSPRSPAPKPNWGVPSCNRETVFDLFCEAVEKRPDTVALVTAECQLTYEAVPNRVDHLAREMARRGITSRDIVGIRLSGVLEALIAMLAVSQLRACFAILDSQWPDSRLKDAVEQLEPALLVVDSKFTSRLPNRTTLTFELANCPARGEQPVAQLEADPDNLAYIVFTSGSTGRPKGVMVTHGNLYCSTRSRLGYYGESCNSFLLLSRLTFDSAYAGIWGTLCSGGTLHLLETEQLMDVGLIANRIHDDLIIQYLSIPSLHRLLLKELGPIDHLALQAVIMAGEELTRDVVQAQHTTLPSVALFNEYGPSEATVWSTVSHLISGPAEGDTEAPIGKAVEHLQVLVLTPDMRHVSPGVVGELYVAGPGVGRGYLKAPRLTAERFIPNPHATDPAIDSVIYRTGDMVRHRPDGELSFLRRADNQIKVRGFRIEVEEIERSFYQSFDGYEAMVSLREDATGRKRICLYYASREGSPCSPGLEIRKVRAALGKRLPVYCLPDEVICAQKLPRLPNNKLDRHGEPLLAAVTSPYRPSPDTTPSNEIERALSGIWRRALDLPSVDVRQSFFEMGGDSLLANQIVLRAERIFGVRLLLKEFYEEPVITAHAGLLARKGTAAGIDFEKVASIWNRAA